MDEMLALRIIDKLDEVIKHLKLLEVGEKEISETIVECYEPTASTKEEEIFCPIDKHRKKRLYWNWIYIKNTGGTNSCKVGVNGATASGFTLTAGESRILNYKDLKVRYIRFKAVTSTTTLQILPMRPRGDQ